MIVPLLRRFVCWLWGHRWTVITAEYELPDDRYDGTRQASIEVCYGCGETRTRLPNSTATQSIEIKEGDD